MKRFYWIVRAAVIVTCSGLAASAVAHLMAATALAESEEPRRRPPGVRVIAPSDVAPSPAAAGDALVDRNMFCSECVREELPTDVSPAPGREPPLTDLPLRLVATTVSLVERRSFATIRNTASAQQGAYRVGHSIPGAGPVQRILGKYVDFENRAAGRTERISLVSSRPAPPPAPSPPALPPKPPGGDAATARDQLLAAIDAGVRKLDDHHFEVDRSVVTRVLANPTAASRGARIKPSIVDGKPNGFRMYAVRSSSVYARIGFKSGDTIHAINGFELTSMDKALEVYTKVREANALTVSVTRRGKPMTLEYTIK